MRYFIIKISSLIAGLVFSSACGAQVSVHDGLFDSEGVRIHYIDAGEGEAVFLHHGQGGNAQNWVDVGIVERLAPRFRVIAIDARGHGRSDKPHTPESYGVKMSDDIIRLLDHLGIEKAHIVGYSFGVWASIKAVESHPDRFLSATFVGAAPDWEWPQELDDRVRANAKKMRESPEQRVVDLGQDNLALSFVIEGNSQLVVSKQSLEELSFPLMAIVGSEDRQFTPVRKFAELLPNMKYVVMDGVDHNGAIRAPQFADSLVQFLAEIRN